MDPRTRRLSNLGRFTPGYQPNPGPQARFHSSEAFGRGYGGAAGGGKSFGGLQECIRFCWANPGSNNVAFRRTYGELEESLILKFLEVTPADWFRYNHSQHVATFTNGSRLWFRHCRDERWVYRYQSAQFDSIFIDEATHFTWPMVQYLLSRLRATRDGIRPRVWFASNPGNVGHAWFKALFVDREPDGTPGSDALAFAAEHELDLDQWAFIPAKVWDNPPLLRRDPDYPERLRNLPPDERKALLEGDFDIFQGQFFREFRRGVHVLPAAEVDIPADWPRYLAMDFGEAAKNATLWGAADPAQDPPRLYVYREHVKAGQSLAQNCSEIVELCHGERYVRRVGDPSMAAKRSEGRSRVSLFDQARRAGLSLDPAFNDRAAGWSLVRDYLRIRDDGLPGLIILDCCVDVVRALPALVYSETDPRDIKEAAGVDDHSPDALRYLTAAAAGRRRAAMEVMIL